MEVYISGSPIKETSVQPPALLALAALASAAQGLAEFPFENESGWYEILGQAYLEKSIIQWEFPPLLKICIQYIHTGDHDT